VFSACSEWVQCEHGYLFSGLLARTSAGSSVLAWGDVVFKTQDKLIDIQLRGARMMPAPTDNAPGGYTIISLGWGFGPTRRIMKPRHG